MTFSIGILLLVLSVLPFRWAYEHRKHEFAVGILAVFMVAFGAALTIAS